MERHGAMEELKEDINVQLEADVRREAEQAAGLNQQREEAARELQHIQSMLEVCLHFHVTSSC